MSSDQDGRRLPSHMSVIGGPSPRGRGVVVAAGWSPERDSESRLEIARYVLDGHGEPWIAEEGNSLVIDRAEAADLGPIALDLSTPARELLRAMLEHQYSMLWERVPADGPAALLQVCRELDELASVLGTQRPASFEANARAHMSWRNRQGAS